MSFGGNFYSCSDEQLKQIVSQVLDGAAFIRSDLQSKPHESYSEFEWLWFELTELLKEEDACGATITEMIPVGGGLLIFS